MPTITIAIYELIRLTRIFDQFNYDFTTTKGANFFLVGNTSVITDTPLGQVLLSNIGFTVPAGLIGLDGLSAAPTEIISVDVIGGTVDAAVLAIKVGITNPSNLDLTVGDVTFQLVRVQFYFSNLNLTNSSFSSMEIIFSVLQ